MNFNRFTQPLNFEIFQICRAWVLTGVESTKNTNQKLHIYYLGWLDKMWLPQTKMLCHFKIWIRNDPVFYFEEVSWVHLVFCFALVSRRRFITSLKGALLFLFIRSKVDRSLRVICKHKTLNQANVGAGSLISPKYNLPFPAACYIYLFFHRFQLIQNKEFRETPCDLDKLNWNLLFALGEDTSWLPVSPCVSLLK